MFIGNTACFRWTFHGITFHVPFWNALELLALEPRHIEPDGSCIRIRQAINILKGTAVVGTPKSRDSFRDIPVPESVREYAIKHRTTENKFIWEMKKKDAPCNPSTFRDHFKKALEDIPGVGC